VPEPTVGLVFYDLKSALRSISDAEPAPEPPKRAAPRKRTAKPKAPAAQKKTTTRKRKTDAS
jgi:hypothetical protein